MMGNDGMKAFICGVALIAFTASAAAQGPAGPGSNPGTATSIRAGIGFQPVVTSRVCATGGLDTPPQGNQESEREIVARTISSVIGWAKEKNLDLFYSVICHDTDYVSVSPGKRVVKRFEDVKQSVPFWMSPDFKYVRHELRDLRITFSRGGDVAWFYCVLDDINTYKGKPASWENARWTGVVEKRDGKWVVVQQHFSFAKED
jgi:ketosteroid isomerase-like protein